MRRSVVRYRVVEPKSGTMSNSTVTSAKSSIMEHVSRVAELGLLPKRDIQADVLSAQSPDFDGRGVTVAIFDTGIDPGAVGLQTCPDGRPKVVDLVDCTGSGDVNTSTVVVPDEKTGELKGLSGRSLKLNPAWVTANTSNKWRVGILQGYKVFSKALVKRMKQDRRKEWDKVQAHSLETARQRLVQFDTANADPNSSTALKAQRQSLVDAVSALQTLQNNYADPGPVYDIVAFHDGTKWRAAVDTQESGDLTEATAFTNFADERQYGQFSVRWVTIHDHSPACAQFLPPGSWTMALLLIDFLFCIVCSCVICAATESTFTMMEI